MGKLGMKLSRAFSKIGDKAHRVINETKGVAGVLKKSWANIKYGY